MALYACERAGEREVVATNAPVAEAIGDLRPGLRLCGMTRGQFGLLDIIKHLVGETGPAHVTLCAWRVSLDHMGEVDFLFKRRDIRSLTVLLDRSCGMKQAHFAARMVEAFGADSIICTRTHAKFVLIRNEAWNVCVRSSMNLNANPRFEQFDLDDDPALCDFFAAHVAEMRALMPPGFAWTTPVVDAAFAKAMGGRARSRRKTTKGTSAAGIVRGEGRPRL